MNLETIKELTQKIQQEKPLIHHITNQVTINDCANITLAIGASPIMAMDINEVEEVVSLSQALVLNIGTLNEKIVESMIIAGKKANQLNIPIILDPVGVGISNFRKDSVKRILENIHISIIKGNQSEIKILYGMEAKYNGIDSWEEEKIESIKNISQQLSKKVNSVIAVTGETDVISLYDKTMYIENGNEMLKSITGTGCMIASLMGSYASVIDNMLEAAVAGILSMNIAGEIAYDDMMKFGGGSGSFKFFLMDAIYKLKGIY